MQDIVRGTVLTLGVFDGLHLGHQRIMQTIVERSNATDSVPTVDYIRSASASRFVSRKLAAAFANARPTAG